MAENKSWSTESMSKVEKAAKGGDFFAAYELALRYLHGTKECACDPVRAFGWAEQAAQLGLGKAQLMVGNMYALGTGVVQDERYAVYWFKRAARAGQTVAFHNLGVCYQLGFGLKKSTRAAAVYFHVAADAGYEKSQRALACLETVA